MKVPFFWSDVTKAVCSESYFILHTLKKESN